MGAEDTELHTCVIRNRATFFTKLTILVNILVLNEASFEMVSLLDKSKFLCLLKNVHKRLQKILGSTVVRKCLLSRILLEMMALYVRAEYSRSGSATSETRDGRNFGIKIWQSLILLAFFKAESLMKILHNPCALVLYWP